MSSPESPASAGPIAGSETLADPQAASVGGWSKSSIYALAILTLISTLNYFDRNAMAMVLPAIKKEMGLSDTVLGSINGLIVVYAVVGIPVAWLADRWSRRNVVAIGLAFWSAMTFVTGFSANVWQLAVTRLLMAAGESCGGAPSNAMLSDIFSKGRLPVAVAIFTCASSISSLVMTPIAGWIADHYGWRMVFFAAGAPGVLLALVFLFTVKEPVRGASTGQEAAAQKTSAEGGLKFLLGSKSFVLLVIGSAFMGTYLYGIGAWVPTFLVRVHHMNLTSVGIYFGAIRGLVGMFGILLGGVLAIWLSKRDERWRAWTPGLACLVLAPCVALFVLSDETWMWVAGLTASSFFGIMHQPPVYAGLMAVAKPRMRALAVSINLLGATVIGQLVGSILIGALNDLLAAEFGQTAIRYSMLVIVASSAAGGLCFMAAGKFIARDMERAGVV